MFSGQPDYPQPGIQLGGIDPSTSSTAEQARPLPVFWGTQKLGITFVSNAFAQNTRAYERDGEAIGYYYDIQFAAMVCAGAVDSIHEIWFNSNRVWPVPEAWVRNPDKWEPADTTNSPLTRSGDYSEITFDEVFGSNWRLYWGTETQGIDTRPTPGTTTEPFYLADLAADWWPEATREHHPAYKGQCYIVARYHQLGYNTTQVPQIELVVSRWPSGLGSLGLGKIGTAGREDINPVNVILDCLTNTRYGLGLSSSVYDSASFTTTAATLAAEGFGISPVMDRAQPVMQFIIDLLSYFDGFIYVTPAGKIALGLNRGVECSAGNDARVVIEENCLAELPELDVSGINTTRTEVRVQFRNAQAAFKDDACAGHSAGTLQMIGAPSAETLDRPWCTRIALADKMARAAAKHRALPSVKGTLAVRKSRLQGLGPGDPFYLNYAHYGLCWLHCRVTRIEVSDPFKPVVEVGFEQDHGYLNAEAYDATSGYEPPASQTITPPAVVDGLMLELPASQYDPLDRDPRFVPLISRPNVAEGALVGGCLFTWMRGPADPVDVSRNSAGMTFPARCQLREDISATDAVMDLEIISAWDNVASGAFPVPEETQDPGDGYFYWLVCFEGAAEILSVTSCTYLSPNVYRLGIRRGALDTVAQAITTSTPVCYTVKFSSLNAMQLAIRSPLAIGDMVTVKVRSVIRSSASSVPAEGQLNCSYNQRTARPWKPLGTTSAWPATWTAGTTSLIIGWSEQYKSGDIPNDWDGPVWSIDVRLPADAFDINAPATGRRYLGEETPHATSHTINATTLGTALGGRQTCVVRLYTRDTKTGLCSLWWDQKTIDYL